MKKNYDTLPRLDNSLTPQHIARFGRNNPDTHAEAAVGHHVEGMRRGTIPAFIIDRQLVNRMAGCDSFYDLVRSCGDHYPKETDQQGLLGDIVMKSCLDYLDLLVDTSPHGRKMEVRESYWRSAYHPDGDDGIARTDDHNGLTILIQGPVYQNRQRKLTIGLQRVENLNMPGRRYHRVETGAYVAEGTLGPFIWQGAIQEGDIAVINSGVHIAIPEVLGREEEPYSMRAVYQIETPHKYRDKVVPACTYIQFTERPAPPIEPPEKPPLQLTPLPTEVPDVP